VSLAVFDEQFIEGAIVPDQLPAGVQENYAFVDLIKRDRETIQLFTSWDTGGSTDADAYDP
jgi:hypothetical protein